MYSDMRHGYLVNSTGNIRISKGQGHATLLFLKIDMQHQDPRSRAPALCQTLHAEPEMTLPLRGGSVLKDNSIKLCLWPVKIMGDGRACGVLAGIVF